MPKTTTTYAFDGLDPALIQVTCGGEVLKELLPSNAKTVNIVLTVEEVQE